jgi:hypothetical protein
VAPPDLDEYWDLLFGLPVLAVAGLQARMGR